jgi:hypothetical protein
MKESRLISRLFIGKNWPSRSLQEIAVRCSMLLFRKSRMCPPIPSDTLFEAQVPVSLRVRAESLELGMDLKHL